MAFLIGNWPEITNICVRLFSISWILVLKIKFLVQRGHTHFEGSKNAKNFRSKMWSKFQNRLEVLNWHDHNSVGEFWCENEIYELLFPFWPPFPLKWGSRFLLSNIGKWPLNRLVDHFMKLTINNNVINYVINASSLRNF